MDAPDSQRLGGGPGLVVICLLLALWRPAEVIGVCLEVVQCDCEHPSVGILIINCRGRQLTAVPKFTFDSLQYTELTLANNNIQALPDSSFDGANVLRLDLSGNPITTVATKAFSGIETVLKELLISFSSTAEFPTEPLTGLENLELLEVGNYSKASLPPDALLKLTALLEVRFISCRLRNLTVANFRGQRGRLERLSLYGNRFDQIPTEALASLPSLKSLDLSFNQITRLPANSFARFALLQTLIFDGNSLENNIDVSAFTDVALSLRSLSFLSCRLGDKSLESLRPLSQLTILNLRLNNIANLPNDLFQHMTNLQTLILDSNRITSINRNMFQNLSSSMISLDIGGNPLNSISSDTFSTLSRLENLDLTGVTSLRLTKESFLQTRSLKNLSLARTGVGDSIWQAIIPLGNLERIVLASTSLSQVPDYAFQYNKRLQSIDLSSNGITSITQRTLVGLKDSLVSLNLNNNIKMTTLDHCTFFQFKYFDYAKLGLTGNKLECNCGLLWLYQAVKNNNLKLSPPRWTCSNDRLFFQLTEKDFGCGGVTESPCVPLQTTNQTSYLITLSVSNMTTGSMLLSWVVDSSAEPSVQGFTVSYTPINGDTTTASAPRDARTYEIGGLSPSTSYQVCVAMDAGPEWALQNKACTMALTMASPQASASEELSRESLIGVIVGATIGGLLLISLIVIGVVCFSMKKRRREEKKTSELRRHNSLQTGATFASYAANHQRSSDAASKPQISYGSKRYTKNKEARGYYNSAASTSHPNSEFEKENGKPQTARSFSREETDKILALLTAVRSSGNSALDPRYTTKPYSQAGHQNKAYANDERKRSATENHDYDVIPGDAESDYYNEPLDSVV